MASHSKSKKDRGASATKIVGLAGMAVGATVMGLTAGAGTAAASPWSHNNHNNTNTPNAAAPSAAITGVNVPQYGNIPGQIGQAGLGTSTVGTPSCPAAGCYVSKNTALAPNTGTTIVVNGVTTTVPATPTSSIPAVAGPSGTTILLPTFTHG